MSESLKSRFLNGTIWTTGQQIILTALGIIQLAVTSRMLTPLDFGTYAVALFFSSLGSVAFSMGFSAALIQKKGDVTSYLNTTWTASIAVATAATVVIMCFIPFVCKNYFHNYEAIWPSLVILLNGIFVAASNPGLIIYMKEVHLKKIFILNVSAKLFSFSLVLFFVYVLRSYWGLIIALLSESLFRLIYSYYLHPFRPRIAFKRKQFKELYAFSGWIQLKNFTSWLASSLDTAVVGNLLGTHKLGFFNRSQSVASYPKLLINAVIDSVAFPVYAKVNEEQDRIQRIFDKVQDVMILSVGALTLFFVAFGHQIITFVLGAQWQEMLSPFQCLLVAYMVQTLFLSFIPILRAYGFSRQEFVLYMIKILLMTMLLYMFINLYDLLGAGIAVLVCVAVIYPGMIYYVRKKTGLKMMHYLISLLVCSISLVLVLLLINCFEICGEDAPIYVWGLEAILACILYWGFVWSCGRILGIGPALSVLSIKNNR